MRLLRLPLLAALRHPANNMLTNDLTGYAKHDQNHTVISVHC